MKTQILLVEDDPQQSETIKAAVEGRYPNVEVQLSETESDFYKKVDNLSVEGAHPCMVICDMMLPWAFPSADAPPQPPDVASGTFRNAGLRCWKKFRERQDLSSIPWIYFTVLDEDTIDFALHTDEKTAYVQKAGSIQSLFDQIENFRQM